MTRDLMMYSSLSSQQGSRGKRLREIINWVVGWEALSSKKSFVPCDTEIKGKCRDRQKKEISKLCIPFHKIKLSKKLGVLGTEGENTEHSPPGRD